MSAVSNHRTRKPFASRAGLDLLHVVGYYALLRRRGTRRARVAGFELTIRPTVYDPRYYRAPAFFAEFIDGLDLAGKAVADVGTGSGLQALAAARAGAASVVAIDVNPNAVATAAANARANGLAQRIHPVASNFFSGLASRPQFDVILANPPWCDGKAWDIADRAWRAGQNYKDVVPLFAQARERLVPGGVMYMILSSHADLNVVESIMRRAGFVAGVIRERRVFLETLVIYELRPL